MGLLDQLRRWQRDDATQAKVLRAALALEAAGSTEYWSVAITQTIADQDPHGREVGFGRLTRALRRLEAAGLLVSQDEPAATWRGRQTQRVYRLTPAGRQAAQEVA